MITHDIVAVEIVIQSKTDIGYRTVGLRTFKPGPFNAIPAKAGKADVRIVLNIMLIIEKERPRQVVRIDKERKKNLAPIIEYINGVES